MTSMLRFRLRRPRPISNNVRHKFHQIPISSHFLPTLALSSKIQVVNFSSEKGNDGSDDATIGDADALGRGLGGGTASRSLGRFGGQTTTRSSGNRLGESKGAISSVLRQKYGRIRSRGRQNKKKSEEDFWLREMPPEYQGGLPNGGKDPENTHDNTDNGNGSAVIGTTTNEGMENNIVVPSTMAVSRVSSSVVDKRDLDTLKSEYENLIENVYRKADGFVSAKLMILQDDAVDSPNNRPISQDNLVSVLSVTEWDDENAMNDVAKHALYATCMKEISRHFLASPDTFVSSVISDSEKN
eukprot:g2859.t1